MQDWRHCSGCWNHSEWDTDKKTMLSIVEILYTRRFSPPPHSVLRPTQSVEPHAAIVPTAPVPHSSQLHPPVQRDIAPSGVLVRQKLECTAIGRVLRGVTEDPGLPRPHRTAEHHAVASTDGARLILGGEGLVRVAAEAGEIAAVGDSCGEGSRSAPVVGAGVGQGAGLAARQCGLAPRAAASPAALLLGGSRLTWVRVEISRGTTSCHAVIDLSPIHCVPIVVQK
mmetsp:Transcript_40461/g.97036  ORF Transcript_40461/g.97036 Transcript_40461/m.97036 type:complete len:226 (-) Transcript_40461:1317-1994(-)